MVVHACNSALSRLIQGHCCEFEASQGYTVSLNPAWQDSTSKSKNKNKKLCLLYSVCQYQTAISQIFPKCPLHIQNETLSWHDNLWIAKPPRRVLLRPCSFYLIIIFSNIFDSDLLNHLCVTFWEINSKDNVNIIQRSSIFQL